MKKITLLCLSAIFCLSMVFAQAQNTKPQRAVLNIEKEAFSILLPTQPKEGILEYRMPFEFPVQKGASEFLAFSANWSVEQCSAKKVQIFVRFKTESSLWEEWQMLEPGPHAKTGTPRQVSALMFLEKNYTALEIKISTIDCSPEQIELHFYNPGISSKTNNSANGAIDRFACECPQPEYMTREDWCPDGDCPILWNPTSTSVSHLIVHHTATSNTSNDWAAVVRAIWDFHANNNGWGDIGYNWLIDPDGVLYQGRGDNILGAHFCGQNSNTMGTAVIGDFTDTEPTIAAKNTLAELLAWKSCDKDIEPLDVSFHPPSSLNLPNIAGHQDGCSTSCPGNMFYPQMPAVRQAVSDLIENDCATVLVAPTNLEGTGTPTQIDLTWQDNAEDEGGYILERSVTVNNQYAVLATLPPDTESFEDMDVMPDSEYFYRVKAVQDTLESAYSNEALVATGLIAPPTNLEGTGMPTQIDLTWQDNADNEDGYILERSILFNNQYSVLATLPPDTESFQDTDVMPNSGYYYKIKATLDTLESLYSNEEWVGTGVSTTEDPFLNEQAVHVFPNPTEGILNGVVDNDLNMPIQLIVLDVNSKSVFIQDGIEKPKQRLEFSIDLKELPNGIYWLLIKQGKEVAKRKIIKAE